jgi:hypothetical protein
MTSYDIAYGCFMRVSMWRMAGTASMTVKNYFITIIENEADRIFRVFSSVHMSWYSLSSDIHLLHILQYSHLHHILHHSIHWRQ